MTLVAQWPAAPDFDPRPVLAADDGGRPRPEVYRGGEATLAAGRDGRLACGPDGTVVVLDGRIDEPASLWRALEGRGPIPDGAGLILAAWARWGLDFLDHLIGDFAVILWDPALQRLVLGRDPGGAAPLHYTRAADGRWLVATSARGLLHAPGVVRDIDAAGFAAGLDRVPPANDRTLYRGISRVCPGHRVIIDQTGAEASRWWRPAALPVPASTADQTLALRGLLDRAVRRRLPDDGRVGVVIDGGLANSVIATLAAHALGERGQTLVAYVPRPARPIAPEAYPGHLVDPWPIATQLAALCPALRLMPIASDQGEPLMLAHLRQCFASDAPVPLSADAIWRGRMVADATRRGLRILLEARTTILTEPGLGHLHRLARDRRLLALLTAWRGLRRWEPAAWPWRRLLAVTRDGVDDRRLAALPDPGDEAAATRREDGLTRWDPTADRDLISFCLALPGEAWLGREGPYQITRWALSAWLPAEILRDPRPAQTAADWPDPFSAARAAISAELADLVGGPDQAPMGAPWIAPLTGCFDLAGLRALLEDWPIGPEAGAAAWEAAGRPIARALGGARFLRRQVELMAVLGGERDRPS